MRNSPIGPLAPSLPRKALPALLSARAGRDGGEPLARLERAVAEWILGEDGLGVCVGSPAAALVALLRRLEPGSVLLPAWGPAWLGTAVLEAGREAVLVDLSPDTFVPGLEQLEAALDSAAEAGHTVRALVTSASCGMPPPVEALAERCAERGIILIEDCTRALGARSSGRLLGGFGEAALCSLGLIPDAGQVPGCIVLTRSEAVATHLRNQRGELQTRPGTGARLLATSILSDPRLFARFIDPILRRMQGSARQRVRKMTGAPHSSSGNSMVANCEVTAPIRPLDAPLPSAGVAASLLHVVGRLDELSQMRCNHGRRIISGLQNIGDVDPPRPLRATDPAFSCLPLRVDDDLLVVVRDALSSAGIYIGTGPGVLLRTLFPEAPGRDNIASELAEEWLFLPLHPHFTPADCLFIGEQIRRAINLAKRG